MFEPNRAWLEGLAQRVAGRKVIVAALQREADAPAPGPEQNTAQKTPSDAKSALRNEALADAGVQALLEVFPAEIRDVEEM